MMVIQVRMTSFRGIIIGAATLEWSASNQIPIDDQFSVQEFPATGYADFQFLLSLLR